MASGLYMEVADMPRSFHDLTASAVLRSLRTPNQDWLALWTDLIRMKPTARAMNDLKLVAVPSQRGAMRLKRSGFPTTCSMRALALQRVLAKNSDLFPVVLRHGLTIREPRFRAS